MKFLQLSDLHLGKSFYHQDSQEFLEVQEDLLSQAADLIRQHQCDALVIAGDLFDKPVPSEEAVLVLDRFFDKVNVPILCVAGNHDSAKRLQFAKHSLEKNGIWLESRYEGRIPAVKIKDTTFYLLPFIKPVTVRPYKDIRDYPDMIQAVLQDIPDKKGTVLIGHQYIAGTSRSDSELDTLGGLDKLDPKEFEGFAYCAFGHLHTPQKAADNIWYSGALMPYTIEETNQERGCLLVDLKDTPAVTFLPLHPKRKLIRLEGTLKDLTSHTQYSPEDYFHILLEDEHPDSTALDRLLERYPRTCLVQYKKQLERSEQDIQLKPAEKKDPSALVEEFYQLQFGSALTDWQKQMLKEMEADWT